MTARPLLGVAAYRLRQGGPQQASLGPPHSPGSGHIVGQVRTRLPWRNPRPSRDAVESPGPIAVALAAARKTVCMILPVAITPGAMQLAVMSNGPRSCVRYRVYG